MESKSTLQKELKQKKRSSKALKGFYCPISHEIMAMPVTVDADTEEEHTFEEEKIKEWLSKPNPLTGETPEPTNPLTGETLKSTKLRPNRTMKRLITEHLSNNPDDWDKVFKPKAWYEGIITAIKNSHTKQVTDLLAKDPRLLTTPLTEGYTALHLALEFADDELINLIIRKLTEKQKLDATCLKALLQHQKNRLTREMEKPQQASLPEVLPEQALPEQTLSSLLYYETKRKESSPQKIFKRDNSNISTMCELPKNWIATGLVTGKILIQDKHGSLIKELDGHHAPITCFRYLPQKNALASADQNGMIFIWNLETFQSKVLFKHQMKTVYQLNLLSKGPYAQCLTSCSADNNFIIWDLNVKNSCKLVCTGHTGPVLCLEELSDGRWITCSADTTLRLWSSKGEFIEVLKEHKAAVLCVTELDDKDPNHQNIRVASGSSDSTIRIWDINSGVCITLNDVHQDPVTCLLYLGNDKLISGSNDTKLAIWDLKQMKCINILTEHKAPITSLRLLGDNVLSSSEDGIVLTRPVSDLTVHNPNSPSQNHASPLHPRKFSGTS